MAHLAETEYREVQLLAKRFNFKAVGPKKELVKLLVGKVNTGELFWEDEEFKVREGVLNGGSSHQSEGEGENREASSKDEEAVVSSSSSSGDGAPSLFKDGVRSRERGRFSTRSSRFRSGKRNREVLSEDLSGSETEEEIRKLPSSGRSGGEKRKEPLERGRRETETSKWKRRCRRVGISTSGTGEELERRYVRWVENQSARRESGSEGAGSSAENGGDGVREEESLVIRRRMERLERAERDAAALEGIEQKGLRMQYKFNASLLGQLEDVRGHLRAMKGEIPEGLCEMQAALEHRQKLVRLADQHGWDVAAVYDGQELASGSTAAEKEADARRIAKAVKEVERRKKPAPAPVFRPSLLPPQQPVWRGQQQQAGGAAAKSGFGSNCHKCGGPGHKSFNCPKAAKKKRGGAGSQ